MLKLPKLSFRPQGATNGQEIARVGIFGGAGYTGGELLRILLRHPQARISFVHSKSHAGKKLYEVHPDLIGETEMSFTAEPGNEADVWILCVGHGEARKFVAEHAKSLEGVRIIDLSQDFRLDAAANENSFVYGLPELHRAEILNAQRVANPGCFATAIQLGLLPLAKAGMLGEIHTTGITGSTGAGQGLVPTSHFSWRASNIQAYKTLTHQHLEEIYQSLHKLQSSFPPSPAQADSETALHFIPWRGDFTRGIFISSQIHCEINADELIQMFEEFYKDHPFTIVSREPIYLKQAVNTNKCIIQLERIGKTRLVIHSAIDNLLKGASGQAVQNMNLMFGMEETTGLNFKANAF